MVAFNWPKVIPRLEYAAELETQARSNVSLSHLNARIRCLKKGNQAINSTDAWGVTRQALN